MSDRSERAKLAGRRVLVVGAGSRPSPDEDAPMGNGRAISVLAAREGAAVACADIDEDSAEETARLIADDGGAAHVLVGDVADADVCTSLVRDAASAMNGLDGLVLNVGIGAGMRLEGTTPEHWDRTFAVNLRSHFLLCRAALPMALRRPPDNRR